MAEEAKKTLQKKWELYDVSGDSLTRKKKACPKCGGGVFLAEHKDRLSCGNCGYMEKKQKTPSVAEDPQEEKSVAVKKSKE
jgi:ubiquitin-small subunit ribosomal protein S27Ae